MKLRTKWIGGTGLIILVLSGGAALTPIGRIFLWSTFAKRNVPFHQAKFDEIVERVKGLQILPGGEATLYLRDLNEPSSLSAESRPENLLIGTVWVSRNAAGDLTVIIKTKDFGHGGAFGYAYSEIEPAASQDGLISFGPASYLNCTNRRSKVAERWWEVSSCYMS